MQGPGRCFRPRTPRSARSPSRAARSLGASSTARCRCHWNSVTRTPSWPRRRWQTWSPSTRSSSDLLEFGDADTELAEKALADLESLDAEPLVIRGLGHGRYELRIDGQNVGTFSDDDLASGVNLARYNTPMRWQAYRVRWGADSGHQAQRVRRELLVGSADAPGLVAATDALAAREESEQPARSRSAIPKQRQYSVAPVP